LHGVEHSLLGSARHLVAEYATAGSKISSSVCPAAVRRSMSVSVILCESSRTAAA
jgi:hypothetical protein